jgi:hypothetical protein
VSDPFAKYRPSKTPRGGKCFICGGPAGGRVVLTLQERKQQHEDPKKANRFAYPSVDSSSRTYCVEHAIEVYEKGLGAFE